MRINYEALVIAYLNERGFQAYADVPDGKLVAKPSQFVTVEQTSAFTNGVGVGTVEIAVQSWAPSRYDASNLAGQVDEALFSLVNNERPITNVQRNSLYNYPTGQMEPRYQGTYDLVVHLNKEE